MLQNAYLDVKIGVDTEENEPSKVDLILFNLNPPQGFTAGLRVASGRFGAGAPATDGHSRGAAPSYLRTPAFHFAI